MKSSQHNAQDDCCAQCCSWCLQDCLKIDRQAPKKYANIEYELVPHPTPERTFLHPQTKSEPSVLIPREMQSLLQHSKSRQSQFDVVTQQPTSTRVGFRRIPPHLYRTGSSSSTSDSTPPPRTPVHSKNTPENKEDVIDISQSPTGTFSSAYRHSQRQSSHSKQPSISSQSIHTRDSSTDEMMGARSSGDENVENIPSLEFSLYYSIHSESLSIYMQSARDLPPKSSKSYMLVLHLTPERADTLEMKITGENRNCSLSQSFEIANIPQDEVRNHQLVIRVHDGWAAGNLLCGTILSLEGMDLFGMTSTVKLDTNANMPRGEILISLMYSPNSKTLQGIILKMTNSIKGDKTGLSDIYVKVYLVYKGKRLRQWKSSTKQYCLTPIFNEAFQFDLRQTPNIQHVALDVCVMSYDRFSRDEVIGKVTIGTSADPTSTSNQHWKEILTHPQKNVSHWHAYSPVVSK